MRFEDSRVTQKWSGLFAIFLWYHGKPFGWVLYLVILDYPGKQNAFGVTGQKARRWTNTISIFCIVFHTDVRSRTLNKTSNKWSKNFDKRPHHMCHYWRLNFNDPFCSVNRSRDSQYFSVRRTTPKNCPFPWQS